MGLTRIFGTYFSTCVTAIGDATPSRPTVALMRRIDNLYPGSMRTFHKSMFGEAPDKREPYNAWVAVPVHEGDEVRFPLPRPA